MIDADPFWQDKTTGEACPTRGHRLCTVTDPEHRHVAIPRPRCTSVYVPMGAAATLMSYSRPGTAAALAEDPEEARRVMEKVRAASDQIRQCIHDAGHRSLPHRSEDGMEWRDDDPDDDEPGPHLCGEEQDNDIAIGGEPHTCTCRLPDDEHEKHECPVCKVGWWRFSLCSKGTPIPRPPAEHTTLRTCGAPVSYGGRFDAEHAEHAPSASDADMESIVGWMGDNPDAIPEEFREPAKAAAGLCTEGMALSPSYEVGGPLDPRRSCGASMRDTAHREHAETASERARRVVEESEARLCECDRPDERDNPHRHERDDWCALWADATTDPSTLFKVAWVAQARNTLARDALVQTGHFTEEEVSDDVAPRITELWAHHESTVAELCDAIRLTVEYVGTDTLPPVAGWSWYDALRTHAPHVAEAFRADRTARDAFPGDAFDLRTPLTQITVAPCDGWWWKWRAGITFNGYDAAPVHARTAARAEARARARLDDLRAEYARRTGATRVIDLTDEEG